MRKYFVGVLFLTLFAVSPVFASKVEPVSRPKDSPVGEAVWNVLDPGGYRVTLDDGSVLCEIWFRKDIPVSGKKESEGVLFPELTPSVMIGIISFPKGGSDFRGQAVKPGFYSMRYELVPNDANHLGVSPSRDFVLLVPAAADPDPKSEIKFQDLVNLSHKATGTQHPAAMSVVQAGEQVPGIAKNDQDHWTLSAKLKLASGEEIPFGLIVKGVAQQ